ncbi:hypothetical protein MLD38_035659 [Melastoma candidum]|uniref:Uncharacterized protein n=1 Tax=Melastoma candidum TaxID=119954 RepID=A0ACB9LHA9_9MYRT|nr:hypothetical protein MLD38_035659 [Melastoma candidum]
MVEFLGEGLILDGSSFSIHWLIWIQLLVFLLLLLLLYSLSSSPFQYDPLSSVLPSSSSSPIPLPTTTAASSSSSSSSSSYRRLQKRELEEEDRDLRIDRGRRKGGRVEMERGVAGNESGLAEVTHPCHIVRMARMAFLRCFGLGREHHPPRR